MRPRRPSGRAMLAAAAALAALAGAGVAVWFGSGSDDEPTRRASSVASAPEATRSAPSATATVEDTPAEPAETAPEEPQPPQEPTETVPTEGAQKTHFPRERGKPENDPPRREFSVPPAREFSGTGNATLGTVNLSRPALVKWSTKGRFELRFGREAFPIVAPSASGELMVPPYNFERVRVIASGRWKISITPRK